MVVAQAEQAEINGVGEKLNTEEICVQDSRNVVLQVEMMKKRWRKNMEQLLNVGNEWDGNVECGVVEGAREHRWK